MAHSSASHWHAFHHFLLVPSESFLGAVIEGTFLLDGMEVDLALRRATVAYTESWNRGTLDDGFADENVILNEASTRDLYARAHVNHRPQQSNSTGFLTHYLKTKRYDASVYQESHICTICQMEYERHQSIGILNCGHEFHTDCLQKWLSVKNMCPLCRSVAFTRK